MTLSEPANIVETPWAVKDLPPFPPIASRVMSLLAREDIGLKELGDTISSDAVFAGEVLRLANSALFTRYAEVRSILQALALVGLERIKGLAFTVAMRGYLCDVIKIPALQRCWRHSLACAVVADELADAMYMDRGQAYTAGLMHDIGRVALAVAFPREYANMIAVCEEHGLSILSTERELFDIDHCEAGRWLAAEWRLPSDFAEITGDHHDPDCCSTTIGRLTNVSCRMADALGFTVSPLACQENIAQIVESLPERMRSSLPSEPKDLSFRVASKVNALDPI